LNIPFSMVMLLIILYMVYHYNDTGIFPDSVAGEEGNRSGISLRPVRV
jgi:hypothetical protein